MADEFDDYRNARIRESNGQSISRSLFSARSGRAGVPQEFRERQQTEKELNNDWRRQVGDETLQLRKDAADAQREATLLKAAETRFAIASKRIEQQDKMQQLEHSTAALEELSGLDYKDGTFPNRLADIYRRFPRAIGQPGVKDFADRMLGMHETYLKDFRADAQKDIERDAGKAAAAAALAAGQTVDSTTAKVDGVTQTFKSPPPAKPRDQGSISIVTDSKGTRTTVNRPYTVQGDLLAQHDALEKGLKDAKGNYLEGTELRSQIGKLNEVKSQLGFDLLDSKGQVIPGSGAEFRARQLRQTPATQPAPDTATPATATPDAATAPVDAKPKVVRQNGVTYTLQPDGSYL